METTQRCRAKETAAHRRARHRRSQARLHAHLLAALVGLQHHHGSSLPAVVKRTLEVMARGKAQERMHVLSTSAQTERMVWGPSVLDAATQHEIEHTTVVSASTQTELKDTGTPFDIQMEPMMLQPTGTASEVLAVVAPPPSAPNKRRRRKGPAVRTHSDDDLLEEARQLADREREQLRERLRDTISRFPQRCPRGHTMSVADLDTSRACEVCGEASLDFAWCALCAAGVCWRCIDSAVSSIPDD